MNNDASCVVKNNEVAMKMTAVFLSMFVITPVGAELYKCTTPTGKTIYSDTPCREDKSTKLKLRVDKPTLSDQLRAMETSEAEVSVMKHRIYIGMREQDLIRSWGRPNKINTTKSSSGSSEQWIYRNPGIGNDTYVYLQDGVVSTIQSSE